MINYIKYAPFYAISLLPMFLIHGLANCIQFIFFDVFKYRRKVIEENIKRAFPSISDQELKRVRKQFERHFIDCFVELIKFLTVSKKKVKQFLEVTNPELIDQLFAEQKNITLYSAHQGNWEYIGLFPLLLPYKITAFYQPLKNSYFDGYMNLIRTRFGVECIPSKNGFRRMLELKREGTLSLNAIIGDQSPKKGGSKYWTTFFNTPTAFLMGAQRIAQKAQHVVVYPEFKKVSRSKYQVTFKILTESIQDKNDFSVIDDFARSIENSIQKYPSCYLWSHKRWKLKPES